MLCAELHDLTLAEAARLISARQATPVEYTKSLLARTEGLDPQLNAFITRTPDVAMAAARTAEAEIMRGSWGAPSRHSVRGERHLRYGRDLDVGTFAHCIDRVPTGMRRPSSG